LRRLRQEDHKLEASLGYTVSPCLRKQRKEKVKEKEKATKHLEAKHNWEDWQWHGNVC
jgi:hypothetical protein